QKNAELQKKLQAEESAHTPQQKWLTRLETENLQAQRNIADLQQVRSGIVREISEQEKRLQAEKSELDNLKTLVQQYGTQGPAADMLKSSYRLLKQRRRDLGNAIPSVMEKQQEKIQERRFEIATRLTSLDDEWHRDQAILMHRGPEMQRAAFGQQSQPLLDALRHTLTEEKRFAFEVSVEWQRLVLLPRERHNILSELEAFVIANVFWIQDADPLGGRLLQAAFTEVVATDNPRALRQEMQRIVDPENWQGLSLLLTNREGYLLAGVVLILLPGVLFHGRHRLRKKYRAVVSELDKNRHEAMDWRPFLLGVMQASLAPVWLLVTVPLLINLAQTPVYGDLLERGTIHLALLVFLWSLKGHFVEMTHHTRFGLAVPKDLLQTLQTTMQMSLWAALFFWLPWVILDGSPFAFRVLPRIFFTLFEMSLALAFYLLVRPASPLIRYLLAKVGDADQTLQKKYLILRHPWLAWIWLLLLTVVMGLDVTGYRFGAAHLARNGVLTLLTVLILIGMSRLLDQILDRWGNNRQSMEGGTATHLQNSNLPGNLRHFIHLFLILTGLFLLATYWGVNEQALTALSRINLYSVTGIEGKIEFVTVADLVRFVLALFLTFWLLANLPGLFHLMIFSRWQVAEGSQYAVVTITRYSLFLIGVMAAVSWLRLDPSRVGWLVAAMGVGLGFGLQEIVANFVSGIILLVERPIRVRDWVTVGDVTGTVTQI
ncbi:MAG: mechanosensitive ion channel, partial [Magnetococcales bacterium]|nr:mechanosensitive ion channel [Magnetococcales bacterium]